MQFTQSSLSLQRNPRIDQVICVSCVKKIVTLYTLSWEIFCASARDRIEKQQSLAHEYKK